MTPRFSASPERGEPGPRVPPGSRPRGRSRCSPWLRERSEPTPPRTGPVPNRCRARVGSVAFSLSLMKRSSSMRPSLGVRSVGTRRPADRPGPPVGGGLSVAGADATSASPSVDGEVREPIGEGGRSRADEYPVLAIFALEVTSDLVKLRKALTAPKGTSNSASLSRRAISVATREPRSSSPSPVSAETRTASGGAGDVAVPPRRAGRPCSSPGGAVEPAPISSRVASAARSSRRGPPRAPIHRRRGGSDRRAPSPRGWP